MKNHYVSQLVIRRFSKAINTFDTQTKKLLKNGKSEKVFYKDNLYTDEIEDQLNKKLESPFAKLIDEKILEQDAITLTRREVMLVKRFLLIDSVRIGNAAEFAHTLSKFKNNAKRYIEMNNLATVTDETHLPSMTDRNISEVELYMQTLKMYLECPGAAQMLKHPYVTRETYAWAKVFLDSYLTFWDSADDQEFILTDNRMVSEYEPGHAIFEGLDISKVSYLKEKIEKKQNDGNGNLRLSVYASLLAKNQIMYENFDIFTLSSTRCFVLVNPFFRLYSGVMGVLSASEERVDLDVPDIWSSCFETREIIAVPKNIYIHPALGYSEDDQFIYHPCKLSLFDTVLTNVTTLWQSKQLIGFNDVEKVADSLYCSIALHFANKRDIYGHDVVKNTLDWIQHLIDDEYSEIFNQYKDKHIDLHIDPFEFLEKYGEYAWRDIRQNKYALKYLLDNEEMVKTMKNFAFMGDPDSRIAFFKECYAATTKK
jgi:hypothetical protein